MIQIELSRGFAGYPAEALVDNGVGRATIDLENLIVPRNSTELLPGALATLESFRDKGLNLAIITNAKDPEHVGEISEKLAIEGLVVAHQGMINPDTGDPMAGKPDAEMYKYALDRLPVAADMGDAATHFDDQFKGFLGANRVGIERGVWTYPRGRQHRGVLAFRAVEIPIGLGIVAAQRVAGKRSMK